MARKIAFLNEKGGSGKTTLCLNVGAYVASLGHKVLIVDLDPQGHLGKSLGFNVSRIQNTILNPLLKESVAMEESMMSTGIDNLTLIPSNKYLTDFDINAVRDRDRHLKLSKKLITVDGKFDYILIDSPPSLSLLTVNILLAVDEILIPVSSTYLAMDGAAEIVKTVNTINRNFEGRGLIVGKVVQTFYRDNEISKFVKSKLKEYFKDKFAETTLDYDDLIDQAQSFGKPITIFAPSSHAAKMIEKISHEVING